MEIVYEDRFIVVKNPGENLIDITVKQNYEWLNTSLPLNTPPPHLTRICFLLGCDYQGLQKFDVEEAKSVLNKKYKAAKEMEEKKQIQEKIKNAK